MNENFNIAKNFFEIGENLFSEKKYEEAEKNFNLSLKFLPHRSSSLINLGLCKIKLKKYNECLNIINQLDDQKNSSFDYKNLKSLYYGETLQFNKAIKIIDEMLQDKNLSNFDLSNLLNYQGIAYSKLKNYKKALALQNESIKMNELNYDAQCNVGFNNLALGNFKDGWKKYEFRLKRNKLKFSKYPKSIDDIRDKKILIRSEQGLGDIIQFSRFIPKLYDYTKFINVIVPRALNNFFKYKDIKFISSDFYKHEDYDYEIYIGSLAFLLNQYKNFDNDQSVVNPEIFNYKKDKNNSSYDIGLAWSGNPKFRYDTMRSLQLNNLDELISIKNKNFKFYCLQKDIRECDQEYFKKSELIYLGNLDFYHLAKKIINFNLVISSDTSILHLAASLNVKTFGLISYIPDWRWGLEGNKSNWYKTLKLFRQSDNQDWKEVIQDVRKDIKSEL